MRWLRRLRNLLRRDRLDAEMQAEILQHLHEQTRRNVQAGMPLAEAYYAAERQFGNVAAIQEQAREARLGFWLEQCLKDLRFAGRVLAKQRVFTLIAVLTLSIGIGASSAILGVIRAHVLDPVPGHEEDRLVEIYDDMVLSRDSGFKATSLHVGLELKRMPEVFDRTTIFLPTGTEILDGDFYQYVEGAMVDGEFFNFLGTKPLMGRWLTEEDVRSGARENIVISHRWWQSNFGGDPAVIGRQVRVRAGGDELRTVVGVMPPEFRFPRGDNAYWQPLRLDVKEGMRLSPNYRVFGRLAPGVTADKAGAALAVLHADVARQFPAQFSPSRARGGLVLRPLTEFFVEAKVRRSVWVVAVAAAVVLLIVCTNLALLQLARGEARKSEIAVRVALGAGRVRILRQLLVESLLLAAGGGLGGLVLANWLRQLGDALLPAIAPGLQPASIDGTAAAWTFGVACVCGIIFGFFPAWRAGDLQPGQVLKNTSPAASGGSSRRWIQRSLVVGQVALAMLLLCAAGLLTRSLASLMKSDRGFDTAGLVEINPVMSTGDFRVKEARVAATRDLLERLAALPGTTTATMSASGYGRSYYREGGHDPCLIWQSFVTVGDRDYFKTLRLRLKAGRWFGPQDDRKDLKTVVLDADAANALWPGESAIGQHFYPDPVKASDKPPELFEVIGVVENLRFWSLDKPPRTCTFYVPFSRADGLGREFYVRTTSEPAALKAAVHRLCKELSPSLRQPKVEWIEERLYASLAPRRMMLWSALALAGTGLFLSMLGVFGVQLHAVTGRTKEIGIRMALGADRDTVTRMVLAQGMTIVAAGAALGTVGALMLAGAMGSLLYGVDARDPLTFIAVPLLLGAVALLACWLPARRAAKVDPMIALRAE